MKAFWVTILVLKFVSSHPTSWMNNNFPNTYNGNNQNPPWPSEGNQLIERGNEPYHIQNGQNLVNQRFNLPNPAEYQNFQQQQQNQPAAAVIPSHINRIFNRNLQNYVPSYATDESSSVINSANQFINQQQQIAGQAQEFIHQYPAQQSLQGLQYNSISNIRQQAQNLIQNQPAVTNSGHQYPQQQQETIVQGQQFVHQVPQFNSFSNTQQQQQNVIQNLPHQAVQYPSNKIHVQHNTAEWFTQRFPNINLQNPSTHVTSQQNVPIGSWNNGDLHSSYLTHINTNPASGPTSSSNQIATNAVILGNPQKVPVSNVPLSNKPIAPPTSNGPSSSPVPNSSDKSIPASNVPPPGPASNGNIVTGSPYNGPTPPISVSNGLTTGPGTSTPAAAGSQSNGPTSSPTSGLGSKKPAVSADSPSPAVPSSDGPAISSQSNGPTQPTPVTTGSKSGPGPKKTNGHTSPMPISTGPTSGLGADKPATNTPSSNNPTPVSGNIVSTPGSNGPEVSSPVSNSSSSTTTASDGSTSNPGPDELSTPGSDESSTSAPAIPSSTTSTTPAPVTYVTPQEISTQDSESLLQSFIGATYAISELNENVQVTSLAARQVLVLAHSTVADSSNSSNNSASIASLLAALQDYQTKAATSDAISKQLQQELQDLVTIVQKLCSQSQNTSSPADSDNDNNEVSTTDDGGNNVNNSMEDDNDDTESDWDEDDD